MADYIKTIKDLIQFKEPKEKEQFVLKENENERPKPEENNKNQETKQRKGFISNLISSNNQKKDKDTDDKKQDEESIEISKDINENLEYIKKIYKIPDNGDLIIKEFEIVAKNKSLKAFIILFDGMSNSTIINTNILQPLMLLSNVEVKGNESDLALYIRNHLIPHNQVKMVKKMSDILDEVNFGGCGLFVDGIESAYACDVKGWMQRSVDRPITEIVIRGPQEGFTEGMRVNTALIRKTLKDKNLIVENFKIGKRSKTPCSLLYLDDIANESLVEEARRRLKNIDVDFIFDSGELEQFLEDSTFLPAPQILSTERPDRTSNLITQGKVAVLMHGSPFALIMPITNSDLLHSPEDAYVRFPYSNLFRIVRVVAVLFSLLLPGLYIAVTNYHHEMIPTDLLFAIEAAREAVPFPSLMEILMMEFAFELIREAGVRIPGPIGPTLGIIGALILGQAAVAANIVSPILIIVVAVTGIGSFAVPNFGLAFSFRILRFIYIILGALAGFLGITLGIFIHGIMMVSAKSFGVPFMAPFGPRTSDGIADQFLRSPIWKQEKRPDYLNVKNQKKQPKISRKWAQKEKKK